jgi:hypothetical protein
MCMYTYIYGYVHMNKAIEEVCKYMYVYTCVFIYVCMYLHKTLKIDQFIMFLYTATLTYTCLCIYTVVDYENDDDDAIYWEAPQATETPNEPKQDDNDRDNRRGGDKKRFRDESEEAGVHACMFI